MSYYLESIDVNNSIPTKSTVLTYLAYLNSIDSARALKIFLKLIKNHETEIFRVSWHSAQWFIAVDFEKLIPFFEKAIESGIKRKHYAAILLKAWYNDLKVSKELLEKSLFSSEEAQEEILDIACQNLLGKKMATKSNLIFRRYLK